MKLSKLLLAVVAAAVMLGAFVSSASAGRFSVSEQRNQALWTRMTFRGGFGNVVCEVLLSGSLHQRTSTKTVNSLIGYITEGTVLRCGSGFGATINQESFPWHRRYRSFAGALPNITSQSETIRGFEWTIIEPIFRISCTVRSTESGDTILTYTVSSGTITRTDVSTSGSRCGGVADELTGSTTNIVNNLTSRARITIRLI